MDFQISQVEFKAAEPWEVESGLLGWVACKLNSSFLINGLAVRRTMEGKRTLSFPARRDRIGRKHYYLKPLNDEARREVERQVLQALGIGEVGEAVRLYKHIALYSFTW